MTRFYERTLAAVAALFIVTVSLQTVVTVPPAQAAPASLPTLA